MFTQNVAPGVHLIEHAHVNCYLLEDDDGLTLVDAGLPAVWRELGEAIRTLGRTPRDLKALVLTHAHFDHVGVARRLVRTLGIPVYAHRLEYRLAAHPYRYAHENPRAVYPIQHPRAVPVLGSMLAAGAFAVRGVQATEPLEPGATVPVPGRPRVVASPGHTEGHCALHLPERDVLLSGDALVTLDPYTGRTGPRIVAGAATADSTLALASLDALAETGAGMVLTGHGRPWDRGAVAAVAEARRHGRA
ncbi:MBL fold metallo-hydrolase [Citricoccus sp. SGAir0253]|uniref:MBL fold metallo-hydrolase n=1 Tax=Citricoccus sp. SGAir0253 TaxID=2567881 RepID=UPI0010CCC78D|nr:MBL fold metallo-hydrolase [Citricoccus sp. SGAir0253]QCU76960.1 MBL fold metallo-hydrolase [Citricoccus sp. SGAir0253]